MYQCGAKSFRGWARLGGKVKVFDALILGGVL